MGDVEFERRVEEEAGKAWIAWCGSERAGRDRLTEAVRPLVERLAAAEGERTLREGLGDLAAERFHTIESLRAELAREREARRAADARAARIPELEARIIEIDRERSAALGELTKTWRRVTDAEDERDRQAAYGARLADEIEGVKGERDEALSMVRRYRVQLAEVVGREAALRAALADARAGLRALARDLLGVEVAARAVVEVGSD